MKTIILSLSILLYTVYTLAQNPGTWTGSTTQTTTQQAVGIGTLTPIGNLEVEYCDDQQNGVVITKKECGLPVATITGSFDPTYDGFLYPISGEPSPTPPIFNLPSNLMLTPYASFMDKPLFWARIQNLSIFPTASGSHTSRFIVTPYGRAGINIENPRAALDVKSLGGYNMPAAIIGHQKPGTTDRTQHIHFVPLLDENGYNQISQRDDQGLFFTDGQGADGANVTGGLVIAPWANLRDPSVGGLRIDRNGNLDIHGKIKSTQMNVAAKWWADKVFSPAYKPMSLAQLEAYIKLNCKLPDIPSETEVLEQGIDVADMQALQMLKIEELYLHIIAQNKSLLLQQEQLVQLQVELQKLRQQLKEITEAGQ